MLLLIPTFAAAFALSLALTYAVRGWARRVGLVDRPDGGRHSHGAPVPRVGGIAVYVGVAAVTGVLLAFDAHLLAAPDGALRPFLVIAAGAAAIFLVGLWDDLRGAPARIKFLLEILIALAVFAAGLRIETLNMPGGELLAFPPWSALALTVLWLVGITNAFNLIDGSDGVAAGAALFASATMAIVSIWSGQGPGAVVALALAGATLGFLFFNFPPASIFLGDSGSLFLGFTLGALAIATMQKTPTALAIAIPVVSCGLPILDTLLAIARRLLRGEAIFHPDRGHIHHRLRDLGHSPRKVALLLYAACGGFSLLSLLLVEPPVSGVALLFVVTGAVVWIGVQRLDIPELLELRRAVDRGLHQRTVIAHNVRIREAAARMREAADPETLLRTLADAFAGGEFNRVELWLDASHGAALGGCAGVERRGVGYLWSFHAKKNGGREAAVLGLRRRRVGPNERHPAAAGGASAEDWVVHLPFRDVNGHPARGVGHLALWRSATGPHLLTDLRLVALHLQPEFRWALTGLDNGRPSPVERSGTGVGVEMENGRANGRGEGSG